MKRRAKKRGPKNLLEVDPTLQKRICEILADANTIQTACDACGISERTYFDWCQKHASFFAATREARARAKIKLVDIVRNAAKTNANHAQWLLERSWPNEYARTERIEQVGEQADDKKISLNLFYDTGGVGMEKLTDFPIHFSMGQGSDTPAEAEAKQKRLLGQTAKRASARKNLRCAAAPSNSPRPDGKD